MKNFQNSFNECASEAALNDNENKSFTFTNDIEYHLSPDNSMNQVYLLIIYLIIIKIIF